jgi:hypothetical protein
MIVTLSSRNGYGQYNFDSTEFAKIDRLRIEYVYLSAENMDLHQYKIYCDSINSLLESRIVQKNVQMHALMRKNEAQGLITGQWETKYDIVEQELKREKRKKNGWRYGLGAVVLLETLYIILK